MTEDGRGVLYPTRLPTFHRVPAPAELEGLVRWFWIPRWNLAPGRSSRQELLPFPASNLVVQPDGVSLSGPTTGASHRDLRGRGWAVGALLRPGGLASLCEEPGRLRNTETPFPSPALQREIVLAMAEPDEATGRARAVEAYVRWASEHLAPVDESGALANALEDLIATDPCVVRVEQVARKLGLSMRSVQRLARRHIGLTPLAVIRRYRLQEAAQRLRDDPTVTIAQVAADLGYADHAHLTTDFRTVLGLTPNRYRSSSLS